MRTSADQEAIQAIIAEFRAGIRELRCMGSERLLRLGVRMSHWHVMSLLERHGDMPMSRIADLLDVSLSNATGIVDRMEERGLVERVRVPDDRRIVLVRITDRGRTLLVDVEVLRDEMLAKALARLDSPRIERIAAALADLREAVASVIAEEPSPPGCEHAYGLHQHALGHHGHPRTDPHVQH